MAAGRPPEPALARAGPAPRIPVRAGAPVTMLMDRRRPAFAPELLARVGLAWAMICALLLVTSLPEIAALRFPGPDDVLRLAQARDLLAGQGWFLALQGVDAPSSRLVDIPLVAAIALLTPAIGQPSAEIVAAIAIPLLTFGLALLFAGRIAWRVIGDEATGFACLAMALSVPVILQMRPLRIDDHGWQIVLALAALNGLMARNPRTGGWIVGSALALWLAISIGAAPMALAFLGVLALRWLRSRQEAGGLVHAMLALTMVSALSFAATRGFGDLAQHCHAIAPVHLAIFALGAIAATGLAALEPLPRPALVAGLALTAAAGYAILVAAAPQCAGWQSAPGEGLPIWRQAPSLVLQIVVPPVIGLIAALQLAGRSAAWLRRFWTDYALLLGAALALSLVHTTWGAVAGAFAAVPLGWRIAAWIRAARNMRRPRRRVLAFAAMALALLPALPLAVLALVLPEAPAEARQDPR